MGICPSLFLAENAVKCLKIIEEILIEEKSLGIKTLDPLSKNIYAGFYDN